jgi:hypothetical protein
MSITGKPKMLQQILSKIAPESGIIPNLKDIPDDKRIELFSLALASGDSDCIAYITEKLIGDHALSNFIMSRSYNSVAQNIANMAFESEIYAALEAPIQSAIDQYNQETNDIKSLTGDACIDHGHKQSDF